MHDLVDFLVEERYCNTESEAIRILESVSDEFYEYLIEAEASAMEQTKTLKNQLKRELSKPNPNQATILKITKQLQGLKGPLETERSQLPMTSKGLQKTPGRGRAQKPRDVVSSVGTTAGIQRTDTGKISRTSTKLTGISPESRGRTSVRTGPESGEIVKDLHTNPGASGARGTNVARSGGTRGVRTR
jgi:hypothetical protein